MGSFIESMEIYDKYFWIYIFILNAKAVNLTCAHVFSVFKFMGILFSTLFFKLEVYCNKVNVFIEMEEMENERIQKYSQCWKEHYNSIHGELELLHSKIEGVENYIIGFFPQQSSNPVKVKTEFTTSSKKPTLSLLIPESIDTSFESPPPIKKEKILEALSSNEILDQLLDDAINEIDMNSTPTIQEDTEEPYADKDKEQQSADTLQPSADKEQLSEDNDDDSIEDVTEEELEKRQNNIEVIEVD